MSRVRAPAATSDRSRIGERGMALLIVLWTIVAAALLVSAFNAAARSGALFMASEVRLAQTEALLDAGTEIAAARVIDEDEARRWWPDGAPHTVTFAGTALTIRINDANGFVDLNKADKELLLGLLRQFAGSDVKAQQLCDRIIAARDIAAARKTGSADARSDSETQDRPASASNPVPAFIDVAQLRGIAGMTPELFRALAPLVTVYGRDGRILPQVAPASVLAAIPGLTPTDIKTIRSATRAPMENSAALTDIAQRVGAFLADAPGPAYIVTVAIGGKGKTNGSGRVSVLVPKLDGDAPYRLIAKRPLGPLRPSGLTPEAG